MVKRALVTGITGQDGLYLAELLATKGYEVFGLIHGVDNPRAPVVRAAVPEVTLLDGDLRDESSLTRALERSMPHEVYNLGALSHVAQSWDRARDVTEVTAMGVLNLLGAVRKFAGPGGDAPRFYQASSSEMFGSAQESPQRESTALWPRSPYGVAKAFGHHMTVLHRETYGIHASSGILFNHESPRRGPEFVTRKIALAVADIAAGRRDSFALGNLDVERDWGFAGDYVEAMWLMVQQDSPSDYVVASGESHSIRELLDIAFDEIGVADWHRYVRQDPALLRPSEVYVLRGDASKAHTELGWCPRVGFEELIRDMVRADLSAPKVR